jgi:hypothetical protein
MEYATAGQQMTTGLGRGDRLTNPPQPIDKPSIQRQIEMLDKIMAGCHEVAGNIDRAADRILGPVPTGGETAGTAPTPISLDSRLQDLTGYAERLLHRLTATSQRLNSAI